jgi:hypothetical protein
MTVRPGGFPDDVALLLPLHGPGDRRARRLDLNVSTLGRARGCELCLEASDVSTIHCIVFRSGTGYVVRDCNSRAGTRVNGDTIRGDRALLDGDILQVGPFSFELHLPVALAEVSTPDTAHLRRYAQSRRQFAEHALRLRRQLRERSADEASRQAELQREAARLREKITVYDRRLQELNEADRELEVDREALAARVQEVEGEIARQFEVAEQQVRQRWQEFQQRCQAEEAAFISRMQQQEYDAMRKQVENGQAASAQQETTLRTQRAELARMLDELRQLQEELHRPHEERLKELVAENEQLRNVLVDYEARLAEAASSLQSQRELEQTRTENEVLRMLLQERDRELAGAMDRLTAPQAGEQPAPSHVAPLEEENARLAKLLAEKDALLAELRANKSPKPAKAADELERYEAELNQERQQLEQERVKLTSELEQLRARNQELDEATREMEMEMSRERAELARERIRMERMREELKVDTEKLQREMSVRESLAPVQRLREELNQKRSKSVDPAAERLRNLRAGNDTPRA